RFSAEPADHDFGDAIRRPVTKTVARALVYVDAEERSIRWLAPPDLERWHVTTSEAEEAAAKNMAGLLAQTPARVEKVESHHLGMLETHSPFKASLIFAPNLKEVVRPKLGWPVYAVVPCRDFIYVFPKRDEELIPRMGRVVVDEYTQSGYPI